MTDLWSALRDVTQLFERRNLPYAVMGGIAVGFHGIPRPTYDVDFTLAIARESLPDLYRELESHGFSVPEPFASGWVDYVSGLPVVKLKLYARGRTVDIDVFLAESRFQASVIQRRKKELIRNIPCYLVSAEDLILLKLIADRPRDIVDIADVLFTQGQLDKEYLCHWADEMKVRDRLDKVLIGHYDV
jgi:hypothetical protein